MLCWLASNLDPHCTKLQTKKYIYIYVQQPVTLYNYLPIYKLLSRDLNRMLHVLILLNIQGVSQPAKPTRNFNKQSNQTRKITVPDGANNRGRS